MKILSIILLILFFFWTFKVKKQELIKIDNKIYNKFKIKEPFITLYKVITILGSAPFLIIACALILLVFQNKIAISLAIFMLSEWILNHILKHIVKRDRPNIRRLVSEKGYSYPSGHTMSSTCFYGVLIFLTFLSALNIYLKIILIILLLITIILICLSRIYLGVHYFSDIVGAVLISLSLICIYVYFMSYVLSIL